MVQGRDVDDLESEADGNENYPIEEFLHKRSTVDVRNAIETILNFSLFIESEEIRISTVKMSKIVEKELVKVTRQSELVKQIKITDFFSED